MISSAVDVLCGMADLDVGSNCHAGVNDRLGDSKGAKDGEGSGVVGGVVGRAVDDADTSVALRRVRQRIDPAKWKYGRLGAWGWAGVG